MGDDIPLAGLLGLLAVLLLLSAFFSGSETALMSLNRYQLRHKAREGNRGAKLAEQLLQRPDRLLGLILLGNNLVNFTAASLVGVIAFQIGGQPAAAVGTILLTLAVLIFSETAPKTLAALHPERLAFPAAIIYYPLLKITYPLVWLTNAASNGVLFLLGVRDKGDDLHSLTREELRTVVHEAGARISSRYRKMLISILDLEKVTVDDVMVPHNEIVGIDLDGDDAEIEATIAESQHTRLPVYRDDIDKVIGVLHLRRLANLAHKKLDKVTLQSLLIEPYFVPENKKLDRLLHQFKSRKLHMAIIVDEHGGVSGLITLEDALEEIVGEIRDETDKEEPRIVKRKNKEWVVLGKTEIDDVNEKIGMEIPDTREYDTFSGYVLDSIGRIPKEKEEIIIGAYVITVEEMDGNRINKYTVRKHE